MASNAILNTLAHIAAYSPCAGSFGRWKADLQDDDADLWNDLTLVNVIPDVKPPDIPKVVEVVSCSDVSGEDVSTLAYESYHQHNLPSAPYTTRESSNNHQSPKRQQPLGLMPKQNRPSSRYHTDPDPELEQVLEEIGLEAEDDENNNGRNGDAELESIMGPRSQISASRSHASQSIHRASSAPVQTNLQSLLLQQREHYHTTLARHHSDSPVRATPTKEVRENLEGPGFRGDQEQQQPNYTDCDGSSYSSVCQKISFFKRTRNSLFRSSSSSSSIYKKAGAEGNWLLLEHSGSSTEETTISTVKPKNIHRPHQSRIRFKPFH